MEKAALKTSSKERPLSFEFEQKREFLQGEKKKR